MELDFAPVHSRSGAEHRRRDKDLYSQCVLVHVQIKVCQGLAANSFRIALLQNCYLSNSSHIHLQECFWQIRKTVSFKSNITSITKKSIGLQGENGDSSLYCSQLPSWRSDLSKQTNFTLLLRYLPRVIWRKANICQIKLNFKG